MSHRHEAPMGRTSRRNEGSQVRGEVKAWMSGYFSGLLPRQGLRVEGVQGAARYPSPVNEEGLRVTRDGRCAAAPAGEPSTPYYIHRRQPSRGVSNRTTGHPDDIRNPPPAKLPLRTQYHPKRISKTQPTRLQPQLPPPSRHPENCNTRKPKSHPRLTFRIQPLRAHEPRSSTPPSHPPPGPRPLQLIDTTRFPPWISSRGSPRPSLAQGSAFK